MEMPKDYPYKAKQYQKQYQKPHQKKKSAYDIIEKKQHEEHDWKRKNSDYSIESEHVLVADEIDRLFWSKLVLIGWKINTVFILDKSPAKSVQFMFTCPDCGKSLHSQQSHTITTARAKAMTDVRWLKQVIAKHKETSSGCQPAEYDENGEVISEAIPE